MSANQVARRAGPLAPLNPNTAAELAEISSGAAMAFSAAAGGETNVAAALDVAAQIDNLRVMFDQQEIRQRIVALQDTALGFRTDRDPKVVNRKTQQPNQPYPWEVVKDCSIEATLRGVQLVGNQFNIISGRCYLTKEGFEFLIRRNRKVTDFKPILGVPRVMNGGALVECKATWKHDGNPQSLECTIAVKGDDYSGADQYLGKATRKFLKRCYEMMSGVSTPDGDAGDDDTGTAQIPETTPPQALPEPPRISRARKPASQPAETAGATTSPAEPTQTTTQTAADEPKPGESPGGEAQQAPPAPPAPAGPVTGLGTGGPTVQEDLASIIGGAGYSFDQFLEVCVKLTDVPESDKLATTFGDLSQAFARRMVSSKAGLLRALKGQYGEGGAK